MAISNSLRPTLLTSPHEPGTAEAVEEFLKRRKKATINDVARLAKVSKKTVSRVINKSPSVRAETRESVNEIIAKIGFRPDPQARGLAFRRSFLLGLMYDNPNAQYIVNMQMGALDALRGTGTELVVHPCDRHSPTFLADIKSFLESQRLSGVIILPPIAEDRALLKVLDELDVPYVRVSARHGAESSPPIPGRQVVSRDYVGCRSASEHLALYGHKRIGFIAGPDYYVSAHVRRGGFVDGLTAHEITIAEELDKKGTYSFESGYEAARDLLVREDRPTAIIACNDEMAIGTYKAAFELGLRIPEDLSVIGFDDSPIATRVFPQLTTVRLPTRDMGRTAAETLMNPDYDRNTAIIFDSSLMERGSSGPVPQASSPDETLR